MGRKERVKKRKGDRQAGSDALLLLLQLATE
jgi:hypothetical protein